MPRKLTGTVQKFGDCYRARITLNDGSRKWLDIPKEHATSEAKARKFALECARLAKESNAISAPHLVGKAKAGNRETFSEWLVRWFERREAKGLKNVRRDRQRAALYFEPLWGALFVDAISKADIEKLVEILDAKVNADHLSWESTARLWGLVTKAFRDMSASKNRSIRVREDNPCMSVEGPDRGNRKEKQFLYPSEFLTLMNCERVSIRFRRLTAIATYTYMRLAELRALQWSDIDLVRKTIHIHRSVQPKEHETTTKTGMNRWVPIEPALLPLLKAMREESLGSGRVFPKISTAVSRFLFEALQKAGVERPALFRTDKTSKRMTFHDTRSTGITWRAVRNDAMSLIRDCAGHVEITTTDHYIRRAQTILHSFEHENVFPELPQQLLNSKKVTSKVLSKKIEKATEHKKTSTSMGKSRANHGACISGFSSVFSYDLCVNLSSLAIRGHTSKAGTQQGLDVSQTLHALFHEAISHAGENEVMKGLLEVLERLRAPSTSSPDLVTVSPEAMRARAQS